MKKSTRIILCTGICMISVGIMLSIVSFIFGGSLQRIIEDGIWDRTLFVSSDYDNDYNQENVYKIKQEDFDSLCIDWDFGDVTVEAYNGEDILLEEEIIGKGKIDETNCLRYKVKGETLNIDSSGDSVAVSFSEKESYSKKLTVKLPDTVAKNLLNVDFTASESDFKVNGLNIKNLTVDSEESLIGDNVIAENIDMSTTEGSLQVQFNECPQNLSFDSTDGQCVLILPQDCKFNVEYDTVNGKLKSDLNIKEYSSKDEDAAKFSVSTTNGDLVIR